MLITFQTYNKSLWFIDIYTVLMFSNVPTTGLKELLNISFYFKVKNKDKYYKTTQTNRIYIYVETGNVC